MRKLRVILNRPVLALWGTVGLCATYFLSAGAAFWLIWNVHLPDWAMRCVLNFYSPLICSVNKSELVATVWRGYARLWVDVTVGRPATPPQPDPVAPPFVLEEFGSLLAAWLIWNCVRWINQRSAHASRPG